MAKAKKTATPAKKTVTKAAPAAAAPKELKPLKPKTAVSVVRTGKLTVNGFVVKTEDKPNGRWVTVNLSNDKKKPELLTARASQVKPI